jgi:hypothetical protein
MTLQTSIGAEYIAKKAIGGNILPKRIVAYGPEVGTVVTAGAGEKKLIGISANSGLYNSPIPANGMTGTVPGMTLDVAMQGAVICIMGEPAAAYGDPVKPDALGRAVKASAGDSIIGICDAPAGLDLEGRVKIQIGTA